ncbi:MAG: hypothetical protein JJT78_06790 [Leptospira sp.]|nr:hypothetical protein [Leptospira sp.]
MFFKFQIFALILIVSIFLGCSKFISLRVYHPQPSKKLNGELESSNIIWDDQIKKGENLGFHDPFIFRSRELPNQYGDLVYILDREIRNNPKRFRKIIDGKANIRIEKFDLRTDDSCWSNTTSIELLISIVDQNKIKRFEYRDYIKSHVTDCFLVGSSITLVPLLIYTPYVGFRGDREDQINQLGRNGISAILRFLARETSRGSNVQ